MATLLSMDIGYSNGAFNLGAGFPVKASFIEEVLPRLNLNFHNPELNGFTKQHNGTAEASNGVGSGLPDGIFGIHRWYTF
jgi:hypothetical protein